MEVEVEVEVEAMKEGEEERNWVSLPSEVLNLVAQCLRQISDFVRFRAVCHAWRSSALITELPPQFPLILDDCICFRRSPSILDKTNLNLRFYSPPFNKTYNIPSPRFVHDILPGPYSHGYMSTLPQSERGLSPISLLNPLTNHEIILPARPFVDFHWIGPRQNQTGDNVVVCYTNSRSQCFRKPQCLVLAFCHPGQNDWHRVKLGSGYGNCRHFYLRAMLFSVHRCTGVTKVTRIANGATLAYVVPSPVEGHWVDCIAHDCLVEDSLGDILRVSLKYNFFTINNFDVYRLDIGDKNGSSPCWVKVSSIGNQAIFMDMDGGFVLRAGKFSEIKDNSIYFLKRWNRGYKLPPSYKVIRIDIETGAIEHLPCPLKKPTSWLLPNLHHL